jgi:hypothetical protein
MTEGHADEAGVAVGPGRGPEVAGAEAVSDEPSPQPLSSAEYSVAFTPRNVAIGLAIVAGIVAFALSRRRRGDIADDID